MKHCPHCGRPIVRREGERPYDHRVRRTCGDRACVRAVQRAALDRRETWDRIDHGAESGALDPAWVRQARRCLTDRELELCTHEARRDALEARGATVEGGPHVL